MKGYKIFNPDWICKDFQYEVGKTYEHKGEIELCKSGFHFCKDPVELFNYYSFNPENKIAKIEAIGKIKSSETSSKYVTDKIKIIKEIQWNKLLELVNTGKDNFGYRNSGQCNYGHCNSNNYNFGNWNSGNCNFGHFNSGSHNSGDGNSNDYNSGCYNSGSYNSGDCNSGDWNSTNFSSGVFCTKEPKILIFDEPTNMTLNEWRQTKAYLLLSRMKLTQWVSEANMTKTEKEKHPEYKTQGGYLKRYSFKEACQNMWGGFSEEEKEIIKNIPNFDPNKFKKITGIKV